MTTIAERTEAVEGRSVAHLPVGAFALVMGVAGLAVTWLKAGVAWGLGSVAGRTLAVLALAAFAVIATGYAVKVVSHTAAVVAEWTHPVRVAFTATIPISLMVLAIPFLDWLPALSAGLWWAGAAVQAVVTLWVVRTWIADATVQQVHVHPAWFIPAVGNLIAPVAGAAHAPAAVTWYFLGVGATYYLGLLPIVLGRLFVAGTLPPRLAPTLAILVAPPAVASLAWVRLGGSWDDALVKVLLGVGIFQFLLLLVQIPSLRSVPFTMSSWAYSFPLAALASALLASGPGGGLDYAPLAAAVVGLASVVVAALLWLTVRAAVRGEICRPE